MSLTHRILKWAGAGIVFTAVVFSSGCSWNASHDQPPAEALVPAQDPVAPVPAAPLTPNIFGEFATLTPSTAPSSLEAGYQQHTLCDEGYDADVAIDPTGKWIAFSSTRHSEQPEIYLQRIDGASVIQLTSDPAADAQPVFSPDGKRIAFCSTRGGNWDIYIMDAVGKDVQQITTGPVQKMHPSFAPDGNRLVYSALSARTNQWELWTIDLTTHEKRIIGQGLFPSWSPQKDVDRIAFQRARQRGSRWFSAWTVDLINSEPTRLTEVAVSSNAAVVSPCWSPDGKHLAFTTILQPAGKDGPAQQDIWVVDTDGGSRQRLTGGVAANLSPFWAVNNRIFFISDRGGHENVWSVGTNPGTATVSADESTGASKEHAADNTKKPAASGKADGKATAAVGVNE